MNKVNTIEEFKNLIKSIAVSKIDKSLEYDYQYHIDLGIIPKEDIDKLFYKSEEDKHKVSTIVVERISQDTLQDYLRRYENTKDHLCFRLIQIIKKKKFKFVLKFINTNLYDNHYRLQKEQQYSLITSSLTLPLNSFAVHMSNICNLEFIIPHIQKMIIEDI